MYYVWHKINEKAETIINNHNVSTKLLIKTSTQITYTPQFQNTITRTKRQKR